MIRLPALNDAIRECLITAGQVNDDQAHVLSRRCSSNLEAASASNALRGLWTETPKPIASLHTAGLLAMASRPSTVLGRSLSLPKQRPTPRAALVGDQPSRQTPTRPAAAVKGAA